MQFDNRALIPAGCLAIAIAALAAIPASAQTETNEQFCARIVGANPAGISNCIKNLGGPTPVSNKRSAKRPLAPPTVVMQQPPLISGSNEKFCAGFTAVGSEGWNNCIKNLGGHSNLGTPSSPGTPSSTSTSSIAVAPQPTPPPPDYTGLTKNQLCRQMKSARKAKTSQYPVYLGELARRGLTEKNCAVQWGKILAGIAVAGLVVAAAADGGGGGTSNYSAQYDVNYSWDQQNAPYGGRQWVCRGEETGRYHELWRCSGKVQIDSKWPG